MIKLSYILLTFLGAMILTSCGKPEDGDIIAGAVVVEDFQPYVDEFKSRMALAQIAPRNESLIIQGSSNMHPYTLGSCSGKKDVDTDHITRIVTINNNVWLGLSAAAREELMFHELGHCLLLRGHDDSVTNGIPNSIMRSYHLGPNIYLANYETYIRELFQVSAPLFAGVTFDENLYASLMGSTQLVVPMAAEDAHLECGWTPDQLPLRYEP